MEFVAGSRSGMYRASLAQSIGEHPGAPGNRPYLQPSEIDLLIQTILEWPDVRTHPRVSDIPLLVLFFIFLLFLYEFDISFFDCRHTR
jgi:hypothetical protein